MSKLIQRLAKLEKGQKTIDLALIVVDDGETAEEGYQRCFPDARIKPKMVLYLSSLDVRL